MSIFDVLPYVTIIGVIVTIIGIVLNHLYRKSDKIKAIIIDLIKNFINPAIEKLMIDSEPHEFKFPDSLNYFFGVLTGKILFKRFSKRKPITTWRIKRYNKLCYRLNEKIKKLSNKAKEKGLIEQVTVTIVPKYQYSSEWILKDKYENLNQKDKDKLPQRYNLENDIKEIGQLMKEPATKAKKLYKKLKQIRDKWEIKYDW